MLKEKAEGVNPGLRRGDDAVSGDITKLLFDAAGLYFPLNDLKQSAERTKRIIKKYTRCTGCTFMFLDNHGFLWKIGEKTTYPFRLGEGIAGWSAKCRKRVFVEDVSKDKRYKTLNDKYKKGTALVTIPIFKEDRTLGVLNLSYANKTDFPPNKMTLDVLEYRLKPILENVILYHEAQEERRELSIKRDITMILETTSSSRQKIEEIRKILVKFVDVENAYIYLLDPKKRQISNPLFKDLKTKRRNIFNDLKEQYTNEKGQKRDFFDLSGTLDFEFINKKKTGYTTLYPIFSGRRMIGFILLEDSIKNIENFSILEKKFIASVSKKIGRYITLELSSKKIIEEKERWRTVFHNVDDGIILLSNEKNIIEANLKARDMLAPRKANINGKNLFSLMKVIDPEVERPTLSIKNVTGLKETTDQELEKKIDNFFNLHKPVRPMEYYVNTKSGKYWIILSIRTAIQSPKSEIYGIIHIKDVTKSKEVEQDKNEFMSMVSHELRTPLTAMKGYLAMTLAADYGKLNVKQEKSLRRIEESTERMVTLVEDILDVTKLELGRTILHKEPINISELVCTMIRELGPKIQAKGITVKVQNRRVDPCLKKPSDEPKKSCKNLSIYVLADRDRLMQILGNLLDNAIKYSFDSGEVKVDIRAEKGFAEVSISDQGVGISPEDQSRLFKRFSRIHNPLSIQAGGTGLGLYITKKLVKDHGGEINVKSKQGSGTTFSIKIPIAKQLPLI